MACFARRASEIFQRCHGYPPMAWLGDSRCLDGWQVRQSRISTWLAVSSLNGVSFTTGRHVKVCEGYPGG